MIKEGLLKAESPRGIWEISDVGRRALRENRFVSTTHSSTRCRNNLIQAEEEMGNPASEQEVCVQEPEPSEVIENERRRFCVAITRAKKCVFIGTFSPPTQRRLTKAPLGSRFLEEMQIDSVSHVLSAVGRLSRGDTSARQALLDLLDQPAIAGQGWVQDHLVANYVADLDDVELTGHIATRTARTPRLPFAYKYAYPAIASLRRFE